MKNLKRVLVLLVIIFLTGCSLDDDFNDTYIYTTIYPVEYATTMLYSDYAKIASVYPNGADKKYEVTKKKKKKYSEGEIFVYSGLANEAVIAKDLLNLNTNIKIIDATKGMSLNNDLEEIWLDPSNFLMLSSNIKRTLIEYSDNPYANQEIDNNYSSLNEKISELDVSLYDIGKNGKYNTILTSNDVFNYLKKYNIDVVSLDPDKESLDKDYATAKKLVTDKKIDFIYSLDDEVLSDELEKFISENNLVRININNLHTLSDDERKNSENYLTLMKKIIEEYKRELYKN